VLLHIAGGQGGAAQSRRRVHSLVTEIYSK
jgi:hypothetical protein